LINKIDLSLYKRIFIDELINKANDFAIDKSHQDIAYCCYIAYQWYKINETVNKQKIIIHYLIKESKYKIKLSKLQHILLNCNEDIKNCYNDNI